MSPTIVCTFLKKVLTYTHTSSPRPTISQDGCLFLQVTGSPPAKLGPIACPRALVFLVGLHIRPNPIVPGASVRGRADGRIRGRRQSLSMSQDGLNVKVERANSRRAAR